MTQTPAGLHPSLTLAAIDAIERSAAARTASDPGWLHIYERADMIAPDAMAVLIGGMTIGEIPQPDKDADTWAEWAEHQRAHLREVMLNEMQRVHVYEGGPRDGRTYLEPKAFLPPQNLMPNGDEGSVRAWPHVWPADQPRYMPHWDDAYLPVRMVWTTPDQAAQVYARPTDMDDLKDYTDYEQENEDA